MEFFKSICYSFHVHYFTFILDVIDSGVPVEHEQEACIPVNIGKALYLHKR